MIPAVIATLQMPLPRHELERLLPQQRPGILPRSPSTPGPTPQMLAQYNVFGTILLIRQDVIEHIDSPVNWEKLVDPELSFAIVRPLTEKYIHLENLSIVYCLLSNRLQFLSDAGSLPHSRLNTSRAALCELLAIRLLNHYAQFILEPIASRVNEVRKDDVSIVEGARQRRMSMSEPMSSRMARRRAEELILANVLIGTFKPFAGGPKAVEMEEEGEGRKSGGKGCNALELAIVTEAKNFISAVACQKVISSVWSGRIYYTPTSFYDIIPDRVYKAKAITLYDTRKAPLLDHYRLRVPRYRACLEFIAFSTVFTLMMIVLSNKSVERANGWEIAFIIYTSGWALDRFATTLEHGWRVFAANLWNGIDVAIIVVFLLYLPLRVYGLIMKSSAVGIFSLSILACESSLIFPRLAFFFLADNVLVMSLRAMLAQFSILMFAAIWMFLGFWHALYTLDDGEHGMWPLALWMVNIWFGLDSTGFNLSPSLHPWFGPILMFLFACLANTLFITVVVAILSTTFAELNTDAKAEFMFRSAVGTLEGVKSDSLFSFQPPINILALLFLLPANWVLSPRKFHSLHVFLTRLSNAPILLLITAFERIRHAHRLSLSNLYDTFQRSLPSRIQGVSLFVSGAHADIEAVFDYAPDTRLSAQVLEEEEEFVEEADENENRDADMDRDDSVFDDSRSDDDEQNRDQRQKLLFKDYGAVEEGAPITGILSDGVTHSSPGRSQLHFSLDPFNHPQHATSIHHQPPSAYPKHRASFPMPSRDEWQSPLKKLYGKDQQGRLGSISESVAGSVAPRSTKAMPDWAAELKEMLVSIEDRQRRIEDRLGL